VRGENRLLTLLEAAGEGGIIKQMERVTLKRRAELFRADVPITHAYFPLTAVGSLVVTMDEGMSVEVGTIGNEGMVGIPLALGSDRSPTLAFVQVGGDLMQLRSDVFKAQVARSEAFANIVRLYTQAFFAQAAQFGACLRFHHIEQRLCRWILMTHDRVGKDTLPLTQEFLAIMLGVQRPSVTLAAAALQKAGLIKYRRGVIDVLDRAALEAGSCECYHIIRKEHERLLC
jgi:CRP-like cAMP-binding protein